MPQVDIGLQVKSVQSKSVDSLIKKLKEIEKLSTVNVKIDETKYQKSNKALADRIARMKEASSVQKKSTSIEIENTKAINANTVANEKNSKSNKTSSESVKRLTTSYVQLAGARKTLSEIKSDVALLKTIDESMFNLGVVAGKTTSQIESMKWELIELATEFPQTSTEIADAIDLVARTGLTFEESFKTVRAGMVLATASGESLADISAVLAKTLVAFSLSSEEASNAINSFYSAVLQTPLSLEGLSQSMKNSASSFATLIDFTTKSGKEFEVYKRDLLDLQVALTGGFAKLGLGASQSGTVIRGFIGRLVSAEKTAVKLFDNLNLQFEGASLTFEKFSKIASEDVFKALDILSGNFDKLAKNRDLLKSLFTQRQWSRIAPILGDINGNTQEWVDTIIEGKDASEGMETQMDAFNVQLKKFNNNITASKKVLLELIKDLGSTFLPIANETLEIITEMEDGFGKTALQIAGVTSAVFALQVALSSIAGLGGFSVLSGMLANPIVTAGILSLSAGISAGVLLAKQQQREQDAINDKIKEQNELYQRQKEKIESIRKETDLYKMELEDIGVDSINEQWENQIDLIAQSISQIKELNSTIDGMKGLEFASSISLEDINQVRISSNEVVKNFLDTEIAIENNKEAIKSFQREIDIIDYKENLEEPLSEEDIKKRKTLNGLIQANTTAIALNEDSLKRYKEQLDKLRVSEELLEKTRMKGYADYKAQIDDLSESLSDRDKAVSKMLANRIVETPADTFTDWIDNVKDFMPEIESIMNQFSQYEGDKLALVSSKNFKQMLPYLSFYKQEIISSNKVLDETDSKIQSIRENTQLTTEEKEIQLDNEYKAQAVAENNLKSSMKMLKTIRDLIINSRKTQEDTTKIYVENNNVLNQIIEKNKVLNKTGIGALLAEEKRLKARKEELESISKTYEKEKNELNNIVQKYKDKGTIVEFVGDELQAEGELAEELTAEYEGQKKKVEGIQKAKEDSAKIDGDLIKNQKSQNEYWDKQLNSVNKYKEKLEDLLVKDMSISDIRSQISYTEEQITSEIQEGINLLNTKKDLSEDEKKQLEETIEQLKLQLGWVEKIKDEDQKIADIKNKQQLLGLTNIQRLEKEQEQLKEKLLTLDESSAEYAQIMYDIEVNKSNILQENLNIRIKENQELLSTVNLATSLIDKISGTDFSSMVKPLTELFGKGKDGKNMFQTFSGMFDKTSQVYNPATGSAMNVVTQGTGLSTAGLSAGLGIASIGMDIVGGINNILNKDDKKKAERWAKQLQVLKSQLNATEELKNAITGYTQDLISTLSELPTRMRAKEAETEAKIVIDTLTSSLPEMQYGDIKLSDMLFMSDEELSELENTVKGYIEVLRDVGFGNMKAEADRLEAFWETATQSLENYKDALEELKLVSADESLRQVRLIGFEGVDFKSTSDYKKELEERFAPLREMQYYDGMSDEEKDKIDSDFDEMIGKLLEGFDEVSSSIGKNLRDGILEGNSALSMLSDTLQTIGRDAQSVVLDEIWGGTFNKIDEIVKEFYSKLADPDTSLVDIGNLTQEVVGDLTVQYDKLMNFELYNPMIDVAKKLVSYGRDLDEIIASTGISIEDMGYTNQEIVDLWREGQISWETMRDVVGEIQDYDKLRFQANMAESEILEMNVALAKERLKYDEDSYEAKTDLLQAEEALADYMLSQAEAQRQRDIASDDILFAYDTLGLKAEELNQAELEYLQMKRMELGLTEELARSELMILGAKFELTDEEKIRLDKAKEYFDISTDIYNITKDTADATQEITNELKEGFLDSWKQALKAGTLEEGIDILSDYTSTTFVDSIVDKLASEKYKGQIEQTYNDIFGRLEQGFSLSVASQSAVAIQRSQLQLEAERNKLNVLRDILDYNTTVDYNQTQQQVQYQTGTTSQNTYNYNYYSTIEGVMMTDRTNLDKLADLLVDKISYLQNNKGR